MVLAGGVQAVATLGTGFLVDRHEPRRLVPLAMSMLALACALPAFGGGVAASWLYALSLGGAYGSQQAINAAGFAQYFGRDHLGAIRGTSFVFGVAGAALGPLPFAASIDWTESYAAVLAVCCGLSLMCGAAAFLCQVPVSDGKSDGDSGSHSRSERRDGRETAVVARTEAPSTDPVILTVEVAAASNARGTHVFLLITPSSFVAAATVFEIVPYLRTLVCRSSRRWSVSSVSTMSS